MAYSKGVFYHESDAQIIDGATLKNVTTADIDITGGTIDEAAITGGTIGEADITGGTIDEAAITGGTIGEADITGGTIDETAITGGTASDVDITDSTISGTAITGSAFKAISVDCTEDYALLAAQTDATYIVISTSGVGKVLTLGMSAGQFVIITNSGDNSVTVKNLVADTGVTATTDKTAEFIVTTGEIIKLTADV